jgi:predicted lipid-binding transport protein (Tim44 family)
MGPNDPFHQATKSDFPHYDGPASTSTAPEALDQRTEAAPMMWASAQGGLTSALIVGAASGAGIGVLSLVATWAQVFQVLLFMGLGVGIAWLAMGLLSGQLDVRAAWRALRKRP